MTDAQRRAAARLDAVRRACERSARIANLKIRRGVPSLAVIASTAPFIGIVGMLSQIPSVLIELTYPTGETGSGISEIFVLPAMGLAVASLAGLLHGILSGWAEHFSLEMSAESLQLMNGLSRLSTKI